MPLPFHPSLDVYWVKLVMVSMGGRSEDGSFSISPHSVGGRDEGAETIRWRGDDLVQLGEIK